MNTTVTEKITISVNDLALDKALVIENYENSIKEWRDNYFKYSPDEDVHDDDISDVFIENLASEAYGAKRGLRNMLRKSPAWNEDLNALVINGNRTHDPDYRVVRDLLEELFEPARIKEYSTDKEECYKQYCRNNAISLAIELFSNPTLDEKYAEEIGKSWINAYAPKAYAKGKKASRILNAFCTGLGIADQTAGSNYQRLFAKVADEMNAKKIDFKLYVSINPAHFLSMSNPKGDERGSMLTSCHSFNSLDYTYNNGCSGYALDGVTMIAFTVDDDKNPENLINRKTSRQLFMYEPGNGVLIQSRLYNTMGGTSGRQDESEVYRKLIQAEISHCENAVNLWKTENLTGSNALYAKRHGDFGGYPDWKYSNFDPRISFRKDKVETAHSILIGNHGLCIFCGDHLEEHEKIICNSCDGGCYCNYCEEHVDEDEDDGAYIEGYGHVCSRCLEEDFFVCDRCGEWVHQDDVIEIENGCVDYYCSAECAHEAGYHQCNDCGDWVDEDHCYLTEDRGMLCESCFDDYGYESCEECGEYADGCDKIIVEDGMEVHVFCSEYCANNAGYYQCKECGEWHRESEMIHTEDGYEEHYFCSEECAMRAGFTQCDHCKAWFPDDYCRETIEKGMLCSDCLDYFSYEKCDYCDEMVHPEDQIRILDEKYGRLIFCSESCAEKSGYVKCQECGEWHAKDKMIKTEDGAEICPDCALKKGCEKCNTCIPNGGEVQVEAGA